MRLAATVTRIRIGFPWLFPGLLLALVMALPLAGPVGGLTWHDQQRLGQIAVAVLLIPFIWRFAHRRGYTPSPLRGIHGAGAAAVLLLGLLSATRARDPLWALADVSLVIVCVALGWTVGAWRRETGGSVPDLMLMAVIGFMCAAFIARFLVSYASVMTGGFEYLNARGLLAEGFSNSRFYSHFQTLTLPLLAWPLLSKKVTKNLRGVVVVIGVLWWMIAFTGGARGTWLGLAVAMTVTATIGRTGRHWAIRQAQLAGAGLLAYTILITWLPAWLDMRVDDHAIERVTTSLTGRDLMWQRALELIGQHPWLGVGPMHYYIDPPLGAHPHQAILQWAAEWGLPATVILLALVAGAALGTLRVLRRRAGSYDETDLLRICLAAAILAAWVQAMLDGNLIMPYSQLWTAILAGWLMGIHPGTETGDRLPASKGVRPGSLWLVPTIAATFLLLVIAVRDAPILDHGIDVYHRTHPKQWLRPRFWMQGLVIPPENEDMASKVCAPPNTIGPQFLP